jgi:hypothetical protein
MKTILLAAFVALSLSVSVGTAYAQGVPPSATPQTDIHQQGHSGSRFDADWGNA